MREKTFPSLPSSLRIRSRMTPHSSGSLFGSNAGTFPAVSNSSPLWTSSVASPPSSTIRVGPASVGPLDRLAGAPPVLLERLALPGEDRRPLRARGRPAVLRAADDDRGGRVVLRREDVAGDPADVGAEVDERLDEDRGLDGHVEAPHDPLAGERLLGRVAGAKRHQAGHLLLGEADLLAAGLGEGEVGDLEGRAGDGKGCDSGIQDGAHASPWPARTGSPRAYLLAVRDTGPCFARMPGKCA